MPEGMEALILRVIQDGKSFNLFIETAIFHINTAVLINMSPLLHLLYLKAHQTSGTLNTK